MARLQFTNGRKDKGSNVKSAHHNPEDGTLTVHFNTGRSYAYSGVPADKAKAFETAESKGKFLHSEIVPHHKAQEITPGTPAPSRPRTKRGPY